MQVKHNGLPVVLWRVPVGFEVDLFPKLGDRKVQNVDFLELVIIAVVC